MSNPLTDMPEGEPKRVVAGDTWTWKRSDLASDYPPASYGLTYALRREGDAFRPLAVGDLPLQCLGLATHAAIIGAGEAPPILTVLHRGEVMESAHRGDVAVVGAGGRLVSSLGNPERLVTLRSAIKPFTAVAVLIAATDAGMEMDDAAIARLREQRAL